MSNWAHHKCTLQQPAFARAHTFSPLWVTCAPSRLPPTRIHVPTLVRRVANCRTVVGTPACTCNGDWILEHVEDHGARSGKVAIAALEHPHAGLRQRRRMPLSIPRYLASQLTTDGANAVALAAREISLATVTRVCPPSHAGTESRHRIACASLSNASSEAHKMRGKPSPSSSVVVAQRQRRLSSGSRRGSRCRHRSRSKRQRRSARGRVSDSSGRYSAGHRVNGHDCSCRVMRGHAADAIRV